MSTTHHPGKFKSFQAVLMIRAGGQWRSHASADDVEERQWDLSTLAAWKNTIDLESQGKVLTKSGLHVSNLSH
jgi:hypothetical protein